MGINVVNRQIPVIERQFPPGLLVALQGAAVGEEFVFDLGLVGGAGGVCVGDDDAIVPALRRFVGLTVPESLKLFEALQAYVTRPENTARWAWRVGDVAIWGNRATQPYAVADYGSQHRVVRRVTLPGGRPGRA